MASSVTQSSANDVDIDLERNGGTSQRIHDFTWDSLSVKVQDRKTKSPLDILHDLHGIVRAGEMLAIMGPSGSGKTTLLNALAHRQAAAGATVTGTIMANGQPLDLQKTRQLSSYVEQEDALIGSLTIRETMNFAAQLALPKSVNKAERLRRISDLIARFGLQDQADTIVGTPIRKGLSGGQKKRLSVASRLVTDPKILFLDEPTSGLDSTLSFEVINFIKSVAKENQLVVIASIHQPSTSTFKLFDKLALLSKGKMCYFGDLPKASSYFAEIGYPMPAETNPAEFYLDLINTDLAKKLDPVWERTAHITQSWNTGTLSQSVKQEMHREKKPNMASSLTDIEIERASPVAVASVLLHRSWIKAYRDIVVYGIRLAMYLGLAILMGTVFLRFGSNQKYIQPYINALFFGGAFMSFMAVAYVPAYLEDRATFAKERANGLVGPLPFITSNFIIGLPFLFVIAVVFSLVEYFLTDYRQNGQAFWIFAVWLFLDLLAAESLVVLVSSIFPNFVIALAVTAFANGLWMCVDGFLVPLDILNPFWKYVFHYIDYQAYVFQGMMVNEFKQREYACDSVGGKWVCQFPDDLNAQGKIGGPAVLSRYNISMGKEAEWFGIMVAIIVVYRVLGYLALRLKK